MSRVHMEKKKPNQTKRNKVKEIKVGTAQLKIKQTNL